MRMMVTRAVVTVTTTTTATTQWGSGILIAIQCSDMKQATTTATRITIPRSAHTGQSADHSGQDVIQGWTENEIIEFGHICPRFGYKEIIHEV